MSVFIERCRNTAKKVTIIFFMSCLSVCPSVWNPSTPTGRILIKFDIKNTSRKFVVKWNFHENLTRLPGILHEDRHTVMFISGSVLRMRNVRIISLKKSKHTFSPAKIVTLITIKIIIIIFINCNSVVTRWQWLFYMYTKHEIGYYWI